MKEKLSLKTKLAIPLIIWFSITGILWLALNAYLFSRGFVSVIKESSIAQINHLLEYHFKPELLNMSREERVEKFKDIIVHSIFEAKKVIFFTPESKVIFSSEENEIDTVFSSIPLENENFKKAFYQNIVTSRLTYNELEAGSFKNDLLVDVYLPLRDINNNETVGVIEIWYPFETQLTVLLWNSTIISIFAVAVLVFFWVSMGFVLNKFLYKDFKNIYQVMGLVEGGDFSKRIETDGSQETNDLISFFNNLSNVIEIKQKELISAKEILEIQVKERTNELLESKQNLEKQVEEKTKELKERLEQLEKFKNETIGRELRIIELKKEIEKLKIVKS